MSSLFEQLEELKSGLQKKLQGQSDKIVLGGLAAVLGTIAFLSLSEGSGGQPKEIIFQSRDLISEISVSGDDSNPAREKYENLMKKARRDISFEESSFRVLGDHNMFDAKQVRSPEELQADARKLFERAQDLFGRGSDVDALREVGRALRQYRFQQALDLKEEIEKRIEKRLDGLPEEEQAHAEVAVS